MESAPPHICHVKAGYVSLPAAIRLRLQLVVFLLACHLVYSFIEAPHILLRGDDVGYLQAARSMAAGEKVVIGDVPAGFESTHTQIVWGTTRNVNSESKPVVSKYPPLYSYAVSLLYPRFSHHALFYVNAGLYVFQVLVVFLLARLFLKDKKQALDACLLFMLGTYSWIYAQRGYPNTMGTLFVTLAYYFFGKALYTAQKKEWRNNAYLSGVLLGVACAARVDSVIMVAVVLASLLFVQKNKKEIAGYILAGLFLPLLWLTLYNQKKFGVFFPFTYGWDVGAYDYKEKPEVNALRAGLFYSICIFGLFVLYALQKIHARKITFTSLRAQAPYVACVYAALAILFVLTVFIWRSSLTHFWVYVVSFFTEANRLVFLQEDDFYLPVGMVMPAVCLLLYPILHLYRSLEDRKMLSLLLFPVAVYCFFFAVIKIEEMDEDQSYFRYLSTIHPFLSVVLVWTLHRLIGKAKKLHLLYGAGALAALFIVFYQGEFPLLTEKLTFPLVLALLLSGLVVCAFMNLRQPARTLISYSVHSLFILASVWVWAFVVDKEVKKYGEYGFMGKWQAEVPQFIEKGSMIILNTPEEIWDYGAAAFYTVPRTSVHRWDTEKAYREKDMHAFYWLVQRFFENNKRVYVYSDEKRHEAFMKVLAAWEMDALEYKTTYLNELHQKIEGREEILARLYEVKIR